MSNAKAAGQKIEGARGSGGDASAGAAQAAAREGVENGAASAGSDDDLRCTLCGLRACWTA